MFCSKLVVVCSKLVVVFSRIVMVIKLVVQDNPWSHQSHWLADLKINPPKVQ